MTSHASTTSSSDVHWAAMPTAHSSAAAEPAEPTEADSLEDYEIVLFGEDGVALIDPDADFTAVADGGEAIWEEIIVADGGDLVIE
ncbi:MAG: hypothetical protein ACERLM_12335 [Acidimicrobiales bacterium]